MVHFVNVDDNSCQFGLFNKSFTDNFRNDSVNCGVTEQSILTGKIREEARRLGFDGCAVARSVFLEKEAREFEEWLHNGYHGKMKYMENHIDMRLDPGLLVPGAKSVISVILNYQTTVLQEKPGVPLVSKYAFGKDYHFIVRNRLYQLLEFIRAEAGQVNGRAFSDSAPVFEKSWAQRSGIGWIGKNGCLISPGYGSFFFIGELITDLDLEPGSPVKSHCGSCTACMNACPTRAIIGPGQIDASRCISYLTIELKDKLNEEELSLIGNRIFGCDACQDVCPWNRDVPSGNTPEFAPDMKMISLRPEDWFEMTNDIFRELFRGTPVERVDFGKFADTVRRIKQITGYSTTVL